MSETDFRGARFIHNMPAGQIQSVSDPSSHFSAYEISFPKISLVLYLQVTAWHWSNMCRIYRFEMPDWHNNIIALLLLMFKRWLSLYRYRDAASICWRTCFWWAASCSRLIRHLMFLSYRQHSSDTPSTCTNAETSKIRRCNCMNGAVQLKLFFIGNKDTKALCVTPMIAWKRSGQGCMWECSLDYIQNISRWPALKLEIERQ